MRGVGFVQVYPQFFYKGKWLVQVRPLIFIIRRAAWQIAFFLLFLGFWFVGALIESEFPIFSTGGGEFSPEFAEEFIFRIEFEIEEVFTYISTIFQ